MRLNWKIKTATAAVALSLAVSAVPAHATPPDANPGADDATQFIRGGGSDTTYDMMQRLETLYNSSPGCGLDATGSTCATASPVYSENYDHDTLTSEFPTGSGSGIAKLAVHGPTATDPYRYARSSRPRASTDSASTVFSGYSKDGLAIVVSSGSTIVNRKVSQDDLKSIFYGPSLSGFSCKTDWSQITNPDTSLPYPAKPIKPYGIQTSSGTSASLTVTLGITAPGADQNRCAKDLKTPCVATVDGNSSALGQLHISGITSASSQADREKTCERVLFENNSAPLDGGTGSGSDGQVYTAPADDRVDAVWWFSNGVRSTDAAATGTLFPLRVKNNFGNYASPTAANVGLESSNVNVYALARVLYHVNWFPDFAATGGEAGASRAFQEWLCRYIDPQDINNGLPYTKVDGDSHALTPRKYNNEINNAIALSGFVRLPLLDGTVLKGPDGVDNGGGGDDIQTRCILDFGSNPVPNQLN